MYIYTYVCVCLCFSVCAKVYLCISSGYVRLGAVVMAPPQPSPLLHAAPQQARVHLPGQCNDGPVGQCIILDTYIHIYIYYIF